MSKLASQNHGQPATTRRSFLKGFAGSAAALSVFPATGSAVPLLRAAHRLGPADAASEPFWRLVKEQFTIRPGIILLNAANLCPSPHMVRDRVFRLTEDLDGDVSFQNRAKFNALLEESRRKLAAFMGASEDEIAIVRNTSEANSFIVNGIGLKAGDEVVVFDQNHPTNNVAWDVRAARIGFTVKRAGVPQIPNDMEEILKAFRAAITSKTRVLSFTDVSNTTGVRLPSKELCLMARERGIHAHVDGAQTFGALPLNLREMGCDSYSASAHKWFMGPKEAGALFIRQERIADIWPSVVGVGWGNKVEPAARGARKFETLGQRDDSAVSAMGTTVDFHNLIGRERTEARIRELAAALKEGVSKIPGARLRTSAKAELSAGVCVVGFDGIDHQKIYEALYAKHGVAGAATGGVRLCPHTYNTLEEIDRTVSALRQVVKELG
ncbi:MAG TPA: aminotransferase class V-fold PLP-dependent enzyme [Blastocatellia bacterium]|nr:aminotransferase class V-fold PLP-dependent enzyme [Blastocatellia bacterium]